MAAHGCISTLCALIADFVPSSRVKSTAVVGDMRKSTFHVDLKREELHLVIQLIF